MRKCYESKLNRIYNVTFHVNKKTLLYKLQNSLNSSYSEQFSIAKFRIASFQKLKKYPLCHKQRISFIPLCYLIRFQQFKMKDFTISSNDVLNAERKYFRFEMIAQKSAGKSIQVCPSRAKTVQHGSILSFILVKLTHSSEIRRFFSKFMNVIQSFVLLEIITFNL